MQIYHNLPNFAKVSRIFPFLSCQQYKATSRFFYMENLLASVLMGLDKLHWIQVLAMVIIIVGMALTNIGKRRRLHSLPPK